MLVVDSSIPIWENGLPTNPGDENHHRSTKSRSLPPSVNGSVAAEAHGRPDGSLATAVVLSYGKETVHGSASPHT
jgi:hypothetical protein